MKSLKKIQVRLFLANFLVYAVVLAVFSLVVRGVSQQNLRQQLIRQTTTLAQSAAANADADDGPLEVEEEYLAQKIPDDSVTVQWFTLQGELLEQQGAEGRALSTTLTPRLYRGTPNVLVITVPIQDAFSDEIIGYVQVSQSLNDYETTLQQLNQGLILGVLVALVLSGIGGLIFNRLAMQPIQSSFQRLQRFTSDASHELRNPLMAISSNLDLCLQSSQHFNPQELQALKTAMISVQGMTKLTEDLLALARAEQAALKQTERIDWEKIWPRVQQDCQSFAKMRQVTLSIPEETDAEVCGDTEKLTRAIQNLIQNAIAFTPARGTVKVFTEQDEQEVRIAIADTGIGIAPEHLTKIFDRFWCADPSRSRQGKGGSGLGLAIAQSLIELHQGHISVTSELGKGSVFTLHLPTVQSPQTRSIFVLSSS